MHTIKQVKEYWESHPLLSYEVPYANLKHFFDMLDYIKKNDIEKFAMKYWEFEGFEGSKVLDVGCGPGWITVQYALNKAEVYSFDLTKMAVDITREHIKCRGVQAVVKEGNVEAIDYPDNFFDLVVSSGVLHHTPNYEVAIKECFRVLKPGGRAKITLYRKGILHNKLGWGLTKCIMKILHVKHPGSDIAKFAKNVDDFIRQYDGEGNPVGIGKNNEEWSKILNECGFKIKMHENHFFPKRFMPVQRYIPKSLHYLLDRYFGTMVYFDLTKSMQNL